MRLRPSVRGPRAAVLAAAFAFAGLSVSLSLLPIPLGYLVLIDLAVVAAAALALMAWGKRREVGVYPSVGLRRFALALGAIALFVSLGVLAALDPVSEGAFDAAFAPLPVIAVLMAIPRTRAKILQMLASALGRYGRIPPWLDKRAGPPG